MDFDDIKMLGLVILLVWLFIAALPWPPPEPPTDI